MDIAGDACWLGDNEEFGAPGSLSPHPDAPKPMLTFKLQDHVTSDRYHPCGKESTIDHPVSKEQIKKGVTLCRKELSLQSALIPTFQKDTKLSVKQVPRLSVN